MNLRTHNVRPAVQAGRFYPGSPETLAGAVKECLAGAKVGPIANPKAVIAPHSGLSFSGVVAGSAFAVWKKEAERIKRIILIGPSHWVDFRGIALPEASAMATPLGVVRLDEPGVELSLQTPGVLTYDVAHNPEHCLEVELPFLQVLLPAVTIVPLVIGRETDDRVAGLIEALWGGDETRFVISSDLSHYLDYESSRRFDLGTAGSISSLNSSELTPRRACGFRAIRGFLDVSVSRGIKVAAVDLRNSGDTAGRTGEVVGYGAFHFGKDPSMKSVA